MVEPHRDCAQEVPMDSLPHIQRDELVYDENDDFIGSGGFGEVFIANLTKWGKEDLVAVKVFSIFRGRER